MGQVLHGSATTTHAIRALIQRLQASTAALSRELGLNVKTEAKWRNRERLEEARMGPKETRSTALSAEEGEGIARTRSWLSGAIRCCRWTTASTRCSPRSLT